MAELPAHPDTGDRPPADRPAPRRSRTPIVIGIAAVVVVVVAMVVLHVTGVLGPGAH